MIAVLLAKFGPYIAGALALLAGVWGYGAKKKSDGRKQERIKADENDRKEADRIRADVDAVERVSDDDIEYRD